MQASDRARNTEQHRRMSRKELKVGLAKVCTTAWVSTLHGEVNNRRCKIFTSTCHGVGQTKFSAFESESEKGNRGRCLSELDSLDKKKLCLCLKGLCLVSLALTKA